MSLGGFGSLAGVIWLSTGVALVGCGDCSEESAAASKFLSEPVNLACQSDDDCVRVSVGCADVARSVCGSAQLNRQAAESAQWHTISDDLMECQSCNEQCGADISV